ncbi:cache domain-containing protein [Desulfoprunum benzoelyticum]|uniref:Methyl-accepting chemotaxis protein n=1 Tax=Desulfoprunum benzoelyticum TaxID=1506996 RepID=A0A840V4J5_9BACT|nr:cache domain-containing protein [Desulfoprunum benzoelyticum]MBB5349718.1 hypothetical protein [Desulfoprunum benzoelyticum]MBM9531893.1 cache domain-containing protein [Desulfoprunum benzoelyticum]
MKYPIRKTLLVVAGCAIVILVATFVNYRITQHVVERTVIAQQEEMAGKAVNTVEIWLNQQMKILEAAAAVSRANLSDDPQTFQLLDMAMQAGHFTDVYIGTPGGKLIDDARWTPPAHYDPRDRPWYRRG